MYFLKPKLLLNFLNFQKTPNQPSHNNSVFLKELATGMNGVTTVIL